MTDFNILKNLHTVFYNRPNNFHSHTVLIKGSLFSTSSLALVILVFLTLAILTVVLSKTMLNLL
jgi:hypothetical protein